MPRTKTTVMALLAGVALIGAAANAEAASSTLVVLDNAALDTVTAGNFGAAVTVVGSAAGVSDGRSLADVEFFLEGQGNESGATALGVIGALGFGEDAAAATDVATQGNLTFEREFEKDFNGNLVFSARIGWAGGFEGLQIPAAARQVLGRSR